MGVRSRLALVLLTTILGGGSAPITPPGDEAGSKEKAKCPYCPNEHSGSVGGRFYCDEKDKLFTPGETAEPKG